MTAMETRVGLTVPEVQVNVAVDTNVPSVAVIVAVPAPTHWKVVESVELEKSVATAVLELVHVACAETFLKLPSL